MTSTREVPVMWLGLAGFGSHARGALADLARGYRGSVDWRLSAFVDADAWLIDGAKVQVLESIAFVSRRDF
jgi:hypothetical protein